MNDKIPIKIFLTLGAKAAAAEGGAGAREGRRHTAEANTKHRRHKLRTPQQRHSRAQQTLSAAARAVSAVRQQ